VARRTSGQAGAEHAPPLQRQWLLHGDADSAAGIAVVRVAGNEAGSYGVDVSSSASSATTSAADDAYSDGGECQSAGVNEDAATLRRDAAQSQQERDE